MNYGKIVRMKIALISENSSEYGRRIAEGVAARARESSDHRIVWHNPETLSPHERFKGYDGIIARISNDAMARRLLATRLPVVDVFCTKEYPGIIGVTPDQEAIGRLAAAHFIDKRYESFAFVGFRGVAFSDARRKSFEAELARSNMSASAHEVRMTKDIEAFFNADLSPIAGLRHLQDMLASLPRPLAVFAANDLLALNVLKLAIEAGIRVPNEMAILGVDDDKLVSALAEVPLSSIDPNAFGVGYAAARILDAVVKKPAKRKEHKVWRVAPGAVSERVSTQRYAVSPSWLAEILEYIDTNIGRPLSTADLVKFSARSHVTIGKAFNAKFGVSPLRYIIERKMKYAKKLIESGEHMVKEVASLSGYTSPARFSSTYAAFWGSPPTGNNSSHATSDWQLSAHLTT